MARHALIVGVSEYQGDLSQLPGSAQDVEAMAKVLGDPELGAYSVTELHDPSTARLSEAIETFYRERRREDVLVFYFSGHGLKDERGELYFATPETEKYESGALRRTSAVPGRLLQECMHGSVSKCQVVILDCCFSGAFARGMLAKDGEGLDFRELGSDGHAVLTSSTSVQYSFQVGETSVYTQALVEGIISGAADEDDDGAISVDELHQFAKNRVREQYPSMRPGIFSTGEGYGIALCQAPLTPLKQFERDVKHLLDGEGALPVARLPQVESLRAKYGVSCAAQEQVLERLQAPFRIAREKLASYDDRRRSLPSTARARLELEGYRRELGLTLGDIASLPPLERPIERPVDRSPYARVAAVASVSIAILLALRSFRPDTAPKPTITTLAEIIILAVPPPLRVPMPEFTPGKAVARRDLLALLGMRLMKDSEKLEGFLSPDMDVLKSVYFFTERRLAVVPSEGQPSVSVPFEQVSGIESQADGDKMSLKIQTRSAPLSFALPLSAGRDFVAALGSAFQRFRASHSPTTASPPPIKVTEPRTPELSPPAIPFDRDAAERALNDAASRARACLQPIGVEGAQTVMVSFTPDGKVSSAAFADRGFDVVPGASCVLRLFRKLTIPAFTGGAVTLPARVALE